MATQLRKWRLLLLAGYLRATPLERGRWRLNLFAIHETTQIGHSLGSRTVRTRLGFRMKLNLVDWVDQHIYATGEYEGYTATLLRSLLSSGDTFVDIGANIGYFSMVGATRVGRNGRVLAFEPVPTVRDRLLHNVRLNKASPPVVVDSRAISDSDATASMFVGPPEHSGTSSLRPLAESSPCIPVTTTRLDDCVDPRDPITVVKIDIEGAEQRALRGMQRTIRLWKPDVIVEVTDSFLKEVGDSAEGLWGTLASVGYRMYCVDYDGVVPVDRWSDALPEQFNALFTARPELPKGVAVKSQLGK